MRTDRDPWSAYKPWLSVSKKFHNRGVILFIKHLTAKKTKILLMNISVMTKKCTPSYSDLVELLLVINPNTPPILR